MMDMFKNIAITSCYVLLATPIEGTFNRLRADYRPVKAERTSAGSSGKDASTPAKYPQPQRLAQTVKEMYTFGGIARMIKRVKHLEGRKGFFSGCSVRLLLILCFRGLESFLKSRNEVDESIAQLALIKFFLIPIILLPLEVLFIR